MKKRPPARKSSHATADKWLATTLCEAIEATGAETFRDDRDIHGGDDIPEEIRSQIQRSREMVVLLSPESVDRPWVLLEVGAAWGWRRNYRIVPDTVQNNSANFEREDGAGWSGGRGLEAGARTGGAARHASQSAE